MLDPFRRHRGRERQGRLPPGHGPGRHPDPRCGRAAPRRLGGADGEARRGPLGGRAVPGWGSPGRPSTERHDWHVVVEGGGLNLTRTMLTDGDGGHGREGPTGGGEDGSIMMGPTWTRSTRGTPDAVLVRRVDGRPHGLPAPGQGRRGGGLRLDGGPDSLCYPEASDSTYPFNPDGSREFLEDKPFIEPFSLIPAMGAVTERLRFVTFVLKLPMRHPLIVAKQATSVAVLTDNRLALGAGAAPARGLRAGRRAVGGRGRRMDEAIAIVRACRPAATSSTTARLRHPVGQDQSGCPRAPAHPGRRTRHACSAPGGPIGRLAPWRRRSGRSAGSPGPARTAPPGGGHADRPFEVHVISLDAYTADGIHRSRSRA